MQNEVYTDHEGFGQYTPSSSETPVNTSVYNFVFHYNAYSELWSAIPRDLYGQYWDSSDIPGIIRSKSIETLLHLLYRSGGDVEEVYKITSVNK